MRFTLVYQGDLPPKAGATEKWRIRRTLEPQLRRLWHTQPLNEHAEYIDAEHRHGPYYVGRHVGALEYMPLVSAKLDLRAELELLLLSDAQPGGLLHHGDIDNRLKTLLDALSVPTHQQAIAGESEPDGRLFCLFDDDKVITRVDVSNDRWLAAPGARECIVVMRVRVLAFRVTMGNIGIVG